MKLSTKHISDLGGQFNISYGDYISSLSSKAQTTNISVGEHVI